MMDLVELAKEARESMNVLAAAAPGMVAPVERAKVTALVSIADSLAQAFPLGNVALGDDAELDALVGCLDEATDEFSPTLLPSPDAEMFALAAIAGSLRVAFGSAPVEVFRVGLDDLMGPLDGLLMELEAGE